MRSPFTVRRSPFAVHRSQLAGCRSSGHCLRFRPRDFQKILSVSALLELLSEGNEFLEGDEPLLISNLFQARNSQVLALFQRWPRAAKAKL